MIKHYYGFAQDRGASIVSNSFGGFSCLHEIYRVQECHDGIHQCQNWELVTDCCPVGYHVVAVQNTTHFLRDECYSFESEDWTDWTCIWKDNYKAVSIHCLQWDEEYSKSAKDIDEFTFDWRNRVRFFFL